MWIKYAENGVEWVWKNE